MKTAESNLIALLSRVATFRTVSKITILVVIFFIAGFLLFPGIYSPLLLDDWGNLQALANFAKHPEYRWYNFLAETPGTGGSGRFLSFLTFVPQASAWPNDGAALKAVNVIIHLFNGLLVFLLAKKFCSQFEKINPSVAFFLAVYITLIWLIHPLFHSSIFYAIQRMALLGATFIFIAILHALYVIEHKTTLTFKQQAKHIILNWSIVLIGCFAKENAISAVFIISCMYLLIEYRTTNRTAKIFLMFTGILPALAFFAYLFVTRASLDSVLLRRDFTLTDRLLTEPRVLLDYVSSSLLPRLSHLGLFHDDFVISRSLFNPFSTLIAFGVHLLVALTAWLCRKQYRLFSFFIAAFYAAHVVESSVIPLEIYFEHRSYVPDVFLFLGAIWCIYKVALRVGRPKIFIGGAVIYLILLLFISYLSVSLWGTPGALTVFWSSEKPHAQRAQEQLVSFYEFREMNNEISDKLPDMVKTFPKALNVRLYQILFECKQKHSTDPLWLALLNPAYQFVHDYQSLSILRSIAHDFPPASYSACEGVTLARLDAITAKIEGSPRFAYPDASHDIHLLKGELCGQRGDLDCAMQEMDYAYAAVNEPSVPFLQILWLAQAGLCKDARKYVQQFNSFYENHPLRFRNPEYANEIGKKLAGCGKR